MKKIIILFMMILSSISYSQTLITDANFQDAINTCLTTNPEDGLCTNSEYGAMPDWDVSNVTDMNDAFSDKGEFNGDISSWDVSNVTNMGGMFANAEMFNQPIGDWDVSSVTDMSSMFFSSNLFNQDIGDWNVSSVTEMISMFRSASSFNQDLSSWNVSNVTYMGSMFYLAPAFNGDISSWDVSSVTNMYGMFYRAEAFNQDIGSWDVSNVSDMERMFRVASSFNQDISNWCVTNISSEPFEFIFNSPLSESYMPVWGTCPTASVDDQNQLDISVYPNPTSDIVYIDGNYTQLKVVVYDILGKKVINKPITNTIDISQLEKGVYILQLSDGAKVTTERIIKN